MKQDIINLCSIPNRNAGTEGEEKAGIYIKEKLKNLGIDTCIEEFKFPLSFPYSLILTISIAIIAAWMPYEYLYAAITLSLLAMISYFGESTARFIILRHLLPPGKSANVSGKIVSPAEKIKVVISAHYDTAHCGLVYHPFIVKTFGNQTGPLMLPFIFLALLTFGTALNIFWIKLPFTILLIVVMAVLLQYELAIPTPGAADNTSGVAVTMAVAQELKKENKYDNISFTFLFPGSEESHLIGMKKYMEKHKNEFDKENTFFINIDTLGGECLKYSISEGFMFKQKYMPDLPALAAGLEQEFDIKPIDIKGGHTDALIPAHYGFKSLNLIAFNKAGIPEHYHWLTDLPENLKMETLEKCKGFILRLIDLISRS